MELQDILDDYIGVKGVVDIILQYSKATFLYITTPDKFGIKAYNYDSGKYVEEYVFSDRVDNITNIATAKDSIIFITYGGDIGKLDLKTKAVIIKNNSIVSRRSVQKIDFNQLVVSSDDVIVTLDSADRVRIWDSNTLNVIDELKSSSFNKRISFIKMINGFLWVFDSYGQINIWDLNTRTLVEVSTVPIVFPAILELSTDQSSIIYVNPMNWNIILFDIKTRTNIRIFRGHGEISRILPISKDLICILTIRGRLILVNIKDDTFTNLYASNTINNVKLLSNGNILISDNTRIIEFNPTGEMVKTFNLSDRTRAMIVLE